MRDNVWPAAKATLGAGHSLGARERQAGKATMRVPSHHGCIGTGCCPSADGG